MITFIIALVLLVAGFFTYGKLVELIFGVEPERKTPALTKTDGVDYVPMAPWRIFLVQFLNIAGLGPIFGAIMGIFYGQALHARALVSAADSADDDFSERSGNLAARAGRIRHDGFSRTHDTYHMGAHHLRLLRAGNGASCR